MRQDPHSEPGTLPSEDPKIGVPILVVDKHVALVISPVSQMVRLTRE